MKFPNILSHADHFHICLFSLLLSVISTPAMARGFYSAVDIGQSSFDNRCIEYAWMSCPTTATTIRLGGGFQFNPNFGIEVDYGNLGSRKMSGITNGGAPVSGNEKLSVFQFDVIGTAPLSDSFSFFGKLAGAIAKNNYTTNLGGNNVTGSTTYLGWSGGLGAQYDLSKRFVVRAQYEYFHFECALCLYSPTVSLFSTGVVLKF